MSALLVARTQKEVEDLLPDLLVGDGTLVLEPRESVTLLFAAFRDRHGGAMFAHLGTGRYTLTVDLLDRLVVRGTTGLDAVPLHPHWVRSLRDECAAANVAFVFEGWGEWAPEDPAHAEPGSGVPRHVELETPWGEYDEEDGGNYGDHTIMLRLGASETGRTLDGREHHAPEEATPSP